MRGSIMDMKNLDFNKESFCEGCGRLSVYTATYNNGGTDWCIYCASANGYLDLDDIEDEVKKKEHELRVKYISGN